MCLDVRAQITGDNNPIGSVSTGIFPKSGIQPLQIGDTVPEYLWHLPLQVVNHPEGKDTITLNEYRGKLIILDFWNTACKTCLISLPKLDSLQRQHHHNLAILLVNAQSRLDPPGKVRIFFEKRASLGSGYTFPSVVADTVLKALFEHVSVPHAVWVDTEGTVWDITSSGALATENVAQLLVGGLNAQDGIGYKDAGVRNSVDPLSQVRFTRFDGRLKSKFSASAYGEMYSRVDMVNMSLRTIVNFTFPMARSFSTNRIIFDAMQPLDLHERYSCQFTLAVPTTADAVRRIMAAHLGAIFGCDIRVEKRQRLCYSLGVVVPNDLPFTRGGVPDDNLKEPGMSTRFLDNRPVATLVGYLNGISMYPVLDETGLGEHLDLVLPGYGDIDAIKGALKAYGLALTEAERLIDVLVFAGR